jgi:two-component system, NtrC family, response regulator HydG
MCGNEHQGGPNRGQLEGPLMTEFSDTTGTAILVVDDDADVLQAAQLLLKRHFSHVETTTDPNRIPTIMAAGSFDAILLDMNFTRDVTSGQEGLDWLDRILQIDPDSVVIMTTAYGDAETAVRTIKSGATDFVIKPWQNEKLLATVTAGARLRCSRRDVARLESEQSILRADLDQPFKDFIGDSVVMRDVFRMIEKVAATDAHVLILGENGTGKELVARAIHRLSPRHNNIFCSVDLGAISETLFESELFGHIKGAFTDARENRAGRIEAASGGTLFFDEISNLPLSLQPKLLSAIQSQEITRVGSSKPIDVDIRLLCASNFSSEELLNRKRFREDLLYRINTVEIHLPPLRDRDDDVSILAKHFLTIYGRKYNRKELRFSTAALTRLRKHHWPGNVRELQHAVERAVILSDHFCLTEHDFAFAAPSESGHRLIVDDLDLECVEKAVIRQALTRSAGNVTKAAELLGLTRTALYRRLQKHGL